MPNLPPELTLQSSAFPNGSLLESYYDRDVTRLSDRGLASNIIGDRWSDVCADVTSTWPGTTVHLPDGFALAVDHVYRLDAIPSVARIASREGLQNPDFIVIGRLGDRPVAISFDAKFSIDTAKSSQVSAESLAALIGVGERITSLLPNYPEHIEPIDGYFLSPDSPLTSHVLSLRRGRLAARVPSSSVLRLPVSPVSFLKPLQGVGLIGTLATLDGYRQEIRTNLLLALYYFRLVRACYGSYTETITPLIGASERQMDVHYLEQATIEIARHSRSSWDVVMEWDARAELVRRQRETVNGAIAFPMRSSELRSMVLGRAAELGVEPPSVNSVRRRFGAWYRNEFDQRVGDVYAPVDDIADVLTLLHRVARDVAPSVADAFSTILAEMLATQPPVQNEALDATASTSDHILEAE